MYLRKIFFRWYSTTFPYIFRLSDDFVFSDFV
nr:MAG TPA: hypothetical protein [Caudoviricetes sp.]